MECPTGIRRHLGDAPMDFPLTDLMDQDACYHKLVELLHPKGIGGVR